MAILLTYATRPLRQIYEYNAIDGDIDNIEECDPTPDPDVYMMAASPARRGKPLKKKNIPTKTSLFGARGFVFDAEYMSGLTSFLSSQRLRDLIEQFEPGVHQFWPMEITHKKSGVLGTKYWTVCCNRIDAINRTLTWPEMPPRIDYTSRGGGGKARLVFDPAKIGGRHFWVDRFVLNEVFMSNALWQAICDEGITGLEAKREFEEILE